MALPDSLTTLRFDVHEDGIALLTVDRPDKLNALNATVLEEIDACVDHVRTDEKIRALVVTGAGDKSFVAGADIGQFTGLDAESGERFARRGQAVFSALESLPKPVVAAVNGYALGGGCELALACHLRIASETARFGQPEVNLGTLPGYGGTQRLPRVVGRGIALELILTGGMIDAQRAHAIGLVNRISAPDALLSDAFALARTISEKGPVAVALALEAVRASDLPLDQGLAREAVLFGQTCGTDDFKEGAQAFLERRKPEFRGR